MGVDLYSFIKSPGVKVMGILNVTPDSFYDGGRYLDTSSAVERAKKIVEEGAHIIDVGAESTRPGSNAISEDEEIARLSPVLEAIADFSWIPVSLDTSKPRVAEYFLKKGLADMINDVEGIRNPDMIDTLRKFNVPAVIMHMFGKPRNMQKVYEYDDVVKDIIKFFDDRVRVSGLDKLIIDPGIGFGKSVENNLEIIRRLDEFTALRFPVLIGASRKSFIGKVLDEDPDQRLEGSLGALAISVMKGVKMVRVHDVKESVRTLKMIEAIKSADNKEIQI